MSAELLSGKVVSDAILSTLKDDIAELTNDEQRAPGLAVILVGDDPASQAYVGMKKKACLNIGIKSFEHRLPAATQEEELVALIESLNQDDAVDGILLQLPLPKGLDENKMLDLISPDKDVDGFHPQNVGKLLLGLPTFKSCTPFGVMAMLEHYNVQTQGAHVVIIGRSNIVGKPLAAMLVQKGEFANATVTVCHSGTKNLASLTSQADILIAAIGRPKYVTADMVKQGAVVIDVGINRVDDASTERGYRLVGDVDFETVKEKVSAITPVPGGVGPMTIAMLMKNTVLSYTRRVTASKTEFSSQL